MAERDAATAAQALTGLAHIRPAGWLATPMPEDPVALLMRARQALTDDHPGVNGRISVVSPRYTAAVSVLHQTGDTSLVLKLHADPAAYAGETLAHALLADTAPVVREAADWTGTEMPALLTERVAAVHTASLRLPDYAAQAMAGFTLTALHGDPVPAWIADPSAYGEVLAAHADAYGADLVPLGHLDLKPEHLRRRADGAVVLLDVESVRPDVTGLIDLVTLPAVLRQTGHELSPAQVLGLYLDATAAQGARWAAASLKAALRAFAAATGLESLHGLDR
ncbi:MULTISPECIES: hypothetical protein [unclassified Streptomyces]|uniref:hypothetical protein n=1 Tax=unclassified Streptomyces TaxID=2593676 RepID=UPI0022562A55|nr:MULTISPECIES: hypothetical protein [unclassified Streptomyces]MCX4554320.1 hypothetical protein [Streptomyces sp. NBC_01500]WSC25028.1 hypothetical protein OIE60_35885 [Streptomyces sp. NBC_01766]